jgi:serine/threonine-protein kinase
MVGTIIGKYRILDRLGRGGMGIVYKAMDETLDREVAIKVLNPDLGEAELLKRFRAEAVSLARLNHPGIATIYELHRHDDDLLMVMEFVRGETLQTLSERLGPLAPPQAAYLCIQVLEALGHAHRAGIIHRDLKPANIMVTDTGVVKVMDFGIARMIGTEHYTHAGLMMGTPAYMAPEQVMGQEIDHRADLYAVGVLFYRLLTRELPFKADTAIAMAQKHVAEPPTPLRTFRGDLPPWCETIIGRALAKAPAARFQAADEFRAAIASAVSPVTLGELPTMATPTASNLLRTADVSIPQASGPRPTPADAVRAAAPVPPAERTGATVVLGGRYLVALVALLVALVAGVVALGVIVFNRGAGAPPATVSPPPTTQAEVSPPSAPQPAEAPAPGGPEADPLQQPPTPAATVARTTAPPASGPAAEKPAPATKPGPAASKPAPITTPTPKTTAGAERADPPSPGGPPPRAKPDVEPAVPPITFTDVKMLVPDGKTNRERESVLTLAGDHLSLLDRSTRTELRSLPYASISQVFYSRSKQPKWTGPDGKELTVPVNLGRMGFFRGDRNWVIFTTRDEPVFMAFEDRELSAGVRAIEERTGIKVRR